MQHSLDPQKLSKPSKPIIEASKGITKPSKDEDAAKDAKNIFVEI